MTDSERKLIVEWMKLVMLHLAEVEQEFLDYRDEKFEIHVGVDSPYARLNEIINQIESGGDLNPAGQPSFAKATEGKQGGRVG